MDRMAELCAELKKAQTQYHLDNSETSAKKIIEIQNKIDEMKKD